MANGTLQLGQALGGQLQLSPSNQSRAQLAKSLLAGSMSGRPAVGGPIEALSRVGQAFFANKMLQEQEQEQQQRQEQLARTLRNSLASGTGGQPGSASLGPPDPQQLSQALLTNPDTAPLGAQIGLSQALQGPEQLSASDLVEIQTPEGPRFAPASEAVGRAPAQDTEGTTQTLSPEQASELGFPEGTVVQRKPSGDLSVKFRPKEGRGSDQRDREITDLARDLEAQGVPNPRRKATRIVDGRARVEVSEDGSRAVFVDEVALAAGEEDAVSEIQLREPRDPGRAEIEPADSLFAMADKATGPQATLRSVTARIPFTNVSESERETVGARRAFDLTINELARGLVNNPKFPVKERQAVIDAIDISPSVFDNPDAMKARLSAAKQFLESRLAQAQRDAQDETLPEKTRNAQASNASAMRNALDRIGQPAEDIASTIGQIADLDTQNAKFVIDDLPESQLREMIVNASDDELNRLPDETRALIAQRLR